MRRRTSPSVASARAYDAGVRLPCRLSLQTVVTSLLALGFAVGCGDNSGSYGIDAGPDGTLSTCGNAIIEAGEDCDDGDRTLGSVCDATCHFTCGNGVLDADVGELCDPSIASGFGSCPTQCNDSISCTDDSLSGSECQATCVHSPITAAVDGDGCCPSGASSLTDSDCSVACGNGLLEAGELCDTGITAGAGACPTVASCNDNTGCTSDSVINDGSCQAACAHAPITTPANNDGCCPSGATSANDNDCAPSCGNGVVDVGETCDTAISSGAGRCPTTCSDGMVCTRDVLTNVGTCTAACTFPPITLPINGDGCCPAGANHNTDSDCAPVCGNMIVEAPEQCDDGNTNANDACSNTCMLTTATPSAFRLSDMDLRDPHVFVNFLGCRDVTDASLAGFSVNGALQTSIQTDGNDADTLLDLSIVTLFRPLNQTNGATTPFELWFPACTSPLNTTSCSPGGTTATMATATTMTTGQCLAALGGTTHPYSPAILNPAGPCYLSSTTSLTISLTGIPVALHDARIAATYSGNPAVTTVNGLIRGFISEADADTTIIPSTYPLVGGLPLSSLLPGGNPPGPNNANCSNQDDRDMNNGVRGWWFYLNFTAPKVPWTGP